MSTKPDVMGFFDKDTATWSYVVWDASLPEKPCAIIDSVLDFDLPSGRSRTVSADRIIGFIKENQLTAQWILETHIHADHLTASAYLKEKLGGKANQSSRGKDQGNDRIGARRGVPLRRLSWLSHQSAGTPRRNTRGSG